MVSCIAYEKTTNGRKMSRLCLPILVEVPFSDPVPSDLPAEEWPWVEQTTELSYKDGEGNHPQFSAIVSLALLRPAVRTLASTTS